MVLINIILFISMSLWAQNQPKFLTKHDVKSIRFITMDGRYAYVKRRPGVLGLVSSYRNIDFMSEPSHTDFALTHSRFDQRIIIESIPFAFTEFNLTKMHKISVIDWGNSRPREIGQGRSPKLHLQDEWLSFYNPQERILNIENLVTTKKYQIKLNQKGPAHHFPEVEMVMSDTVIFTDINEDGFAALIQYNLASAKSTILYKSSQNATGLELCQDKGYLAIGEFPFEGVTRGSKILQIQVGESTLFGGFTTLYSSSDQDIGNILCLPTSIYFVKTVKQDARTGVKTTEAAKLDLKTLDVNVKTAFTNVTQIIDMDGRVMVPMRGAFYVLEGTSNLSDDKLKGLPVNSKEGLPLDI